MSTSFRLLLVLFCGLALMGANAETMEMDSIRLEERDGRYFVIHEVEAGETLYSLSKRYMAEIDSIKANNGLKGNDLDLGQLLMIPFHYSVEPAEEAESIEPKQPADVNRKTHVVMPGETVYSLSKKYELQFEEIRKWNDLEDNNLSIGMELFVSPPSGQAQQVVKTDPNVAEVTDELPDNDPDEESLPEEIPEDYHTHYVQSGETLLELARRFETLPDSLMAWNQLEHATLRIGEKLLVKKPIELDSLNHSNPQTRFTAYGSKYWTVKTETDTLVHEEGVAGTIENIIETRKFLALHRTLPVGATLKVVNLMNHQSLEVRVVGRLPNTGLNRNMMIRFTAATFQQLGIIDRKSRVEIIYEEEEG